MDLYPLGVVVVVPINVTDPVTGAPMNVSPDPTLTLIHPDLTSEVLPVTGHPGVGEWVVALQPATLTVKGRWRVIPHVTGANVGADFEVFDMFDPVAYPRLVSFADAKRVVKAQGTEDDPMLDRVIGWASARICVEYEMVRAVRTQRINVRGGDPFLTLSRTPVRAVTAVVAASGTVVDASALTVTHPNGGMVQFTAGLLNGPYDITYTVGPDEVPPGGDGATLALIQHWWSQMVARRTVGAYGAGGPGGVMPDFRDLPNTVKNFLAVVPRPWGAA